METFSLFLQLFISGIALGAIAALYTLGLSIIWGTSRIINIAHGEFLLIGAYVTYFLHNYFVSMCNNTCLPSSFSWVYTIEPFLYFPIAGLVVGLIGILIQYLFYNKVIGKEPIISLILGFGVSLMLSGLLVVLFTGNFRFITTKAVTTSIVFFGYNLQTGQAISIFLSLGIFILTYFYMEKTDTGRAIMAVSQDRDAALLMGVNDTKIFMIAMFISGFVAGSAGNVIAVLYTFSPASSSYYLGWSFVITVLAGLGSIQGVFFAGLLIGIIQSMTTFFTQQYFNISGIEPAVGFLLMILVILVRPLGLFGRRSE